MTGKERFLAALRFKETDRPPHFESMFELEHEAFGLRFPDRNSWADCNAREKEEKIAVCLDIYGRIVERYQWDALAVYWPWSDPDGVAAAKSFFADQIAVGGMVSNGLWAIETITDWVAFSTDLVDHRDHIHAEAERRCRAALEKIDQLVDAGADFLFLPHDVAFNGGPFVSPADFAEIVTPYLARLIARAKTHNVPAIYHSDGMLMPIFDQILACDPQGLQSIDPMAGMDIAEVKRLSYGKMALMGNVQCNLLQDGPLAAIRESAEYCLKHGTPGGGYIFSTSNTVFNGMPLKHYEFMLDVFKEFYTSRQSGEKSK